MVAVDVGQLRFLSRRAKVAYIFLSNDYYLFYFFFYSLLVSDKPFNAVQFLMCLSVFDYIIVTPLFSFSS